MLLSRCDKAFSLKFDSDIWAQAFNAVDYKYEFVNKGEKQNCTNKATLKNDYLKKFD